MGEQMPLPRPEIRQSPALGRRCTADENPRLLDQSPLKDELSILSPENKPSGMPPRPTTPTPGIANARRRSALHRRR